MRCAGRCEEFFFGGGVESLREELGELIPRILAFMYYPFLESLFLAGHLLFHSSIVY